MKRTYVYIDSFNLYYGILKGNHKGFKWLNISDWLSKLLPPIQYNVQKIKYFSANTSATPHDPQKPVRQSTYFRAIQTLPNLELILGKFLIKKVNIQVTKDVSISAKVPEEKGTDVNIATHAIHDAHLGLYDTAVIVSNDSDLLDVVRILTQEMGLEVEIINPCSNMHFSAQLTRYATQKKKARDGQITTSQFPQTLTDNVGTITKPLTW